MLLFIQEAVAVGLRFFFFFFTSVAIILAGEFYGQCRYDDYNDQ